MPIFDAQKKNYSKFLAQNFSSWELKVNELYNIYEYASKG